MKIKENHENKKTFWCDVRRKLSSCVKSVIPIAWCVQTIGQKENESEESLKVSEF
jgi:hypothetical protein